VNEFEAYDMLSICGVSTVQEMIPDKHSIWLGLHCTEFSIAGSRATFECNESLISARLHSIL
jgi:hypothetical protein